MPNGYNTIIETIKTDNLKSFQSLVHGKSQHLNKIQQFFHLSCQYNSIKILDYLFKLNPKIHIRDKNDLAFILACNHYNLQIMNILYDKNNNINVEKVLLDLIPKINPFTINREITQFLFNKIEEHKSENKLQDVLHKICAQIIKTYHTTLDDYLINKIINKYIHLLDIFELSKITIEYNQLCLIHKFIIYLDDNRIAKLLKISLQNISIEKYNLIEYLMYKANNNVAHDLFEYIKNSCKTGDQKFVGIILSRFNYESIAWMLPCLSYIALYYNHISIVDTIFTYYPKLYGDVIQMYEKRQLLHLENLYNLELSNNQISDLSPLVNLDLGGLWLSENKISDLSPLSNLKTLYEMNLLPGSFFSF
jgi:Leucine-rich repeat (LRR) protein